MRTLRFDLSDRLIALTVRIIKASEALPDTKAGKHLAAQLLRSGTSPAANHAEAQSAESRADFVHKLKIALKELRETRMWLRVIVEAELIQPPDRLHSLIEETDELVSILFKSIETARKNDARH